MSDFQSTPPDGVEPTPQEKKRADLQRLGPSVYDGWRKASEHKRNSGMQAELEKCLNDRASKYDAAELANIQARIGTQQTPVFIPFADLKARTAKTLILEVFLNSSDIPYTLDPTPIPDLPDSDLAGIAEETMRSYVQFRSMELAEMGAAPEQIEEVLAEEPPDKLAVAAYVKARKGELDSKRKEIAAVKAERSLQLMRDQQVEGKWHEAMMACGDDVCTFGTCVLKGPVPRSRERTRWAGDAIDLKTVTVDEWEAISPLDCYPSKGAVKITDGAFYQRVRYTAAELAGMKDLGEGYFPSAIDNVLAKFPNGGLRLLEPEDSNIRRLQNDADNGMAADDSMLEGIEAWQSVRGSMLIAEGVTKDGDGNAIEPTKYYETNVMVFDQQTVFSSVTNKRLGRPLYKGVFYAIRGSWWGYGPMKCLRDPLRMYNAAARDLCVNMAECSGPRMVIGDMTRLTPNTNVRGGPWSVIECLDPMKRGDIPIKYFQPASNSGEIFAVMERLEKLFDTVTGIPAYTHGSDTAAGAGRTYNGLLLIVNASKQGANDVVLSMFNDLMKPALEYQYRKNLLFDPNEDIKGDCEIKPGGLLSILLREQSLNRLSDFLQLLNNPNIAKVVGQTGLATLLRQYSKLLQGVNPDKVVPSEAEMERRARLEEIEQELERAEKAGMAQSNLGNPTVGAQTPPVGGTGMQAGSPPFPMRRQPVEADFSQPAQPGGGAGLETPEMEGA